MVEHLPQDPDQEHLSVSKLGVDNWTCPVALRPWWAVFVTQRRTWAALLQFYRWHYRLEKYFDKCLSAKNNMDLGLDIADDLAKVNLSQNHLQELFWGTIIFSAEERHGQVEKVWDGHGYEHRADGLGWGQQKGFESNWIAFYNFISSP